MFEIHATLPLHDLTMLHVYITKWLSSALHHGKWNLHTMYSTHTPFIEEVVFTFFTFTRIHV